MTGEGVAFFHWAGREFAGRVIWLGPEHPGWACLGCRWEWEKLQRRRREHAPDCKVNATWELDRRCDCEPKYTKAELRAKVRTSDSGIWQRNYRDDILGWIEENL